MPETSPAATTPAVDVPSLRTDPQPPAAGHELLAQGHRVLAELRRELLGRRNGEGHWRGHLASSALSTAVASFALVAVARERADLPEGHLARARRGLRWLCRHANADGGFGDTARSGSNLPTTLLAWASLRAGREHGLADGVRFGEAELERTIEAAGRWIAARAGSLEPADLKRTIEQLYGEDKTFSVPILTLAALAGVLGPEPECWQGPPSLPFELAALPHATFRFVGLPVVSYALPALIAVGQVQHHRRPSAFPPLRALRALLRRPTLRELGRLQPEGGGFLEAIPLTGFVTLSLAGAGEARHPVVEKALQFFESSVRDDGSWPIDVDLATWVTTLSIGGLSVDAGLLDPQPDAEPLPTLTTADRRRLRRWLLDQQYRERHPFTEAAPGGWAWTDLPGGAPDGDDTPGALLALHHLAAGGPVEREDLDAAEAGLGWLVDLQNRDGGMPTFCRGWGKLPFDRSSPDLTAHALRAFVAWRPRVRPELGRRLDRARDHACRYLLREQRADGAWVPLWFGHEAAPGLENKVYGTSRVLQGLAALPGPPSPGIQTALERGAAYLRRAQAENGGWAGAEGLEPSFEETALALDALASSPPTPAHHENLERGVEWLVQAWNEGRWQEATPIGFYFAHLWYFEELYPLAFGGAGLGRALARLSESR